jgi:hypothetical protein
MTGARLGRAVEHRCGKTRDPHDADTRGEPVPDHGSLDRVSSRETDRYRVVAQRASRRSNQLRRDHQPRHGAMVAGHLDDGRSGALDGGSHVIGKL